MKQKLQTAKNAIDALVSDMSVSPAEALEALEEIQAEIESRIDALREEIENKETSG